MIRFSLRKTARYLRFCFLNDVRVSQSSLCVTVIHLCDVIDHLLSDYLSLVFSIALAFGKIRLVWLIRSQWAQDRLSFGHKGHFLSLCVHSDGWSLSLYRASLISQASCWFVSCQHWFAHRSNRCVLIRVLSLHESAFLSRLIFLNRSLDRMLTLIGHWDSRKIGVTIRVHTASVILHGIVRLLIEETDVLIANFIQVAGPTIGE